MAGKPRYHTVPFIDLIVLLLFNFSALPRVDVPAPLVLSTILGKDCEWWNQGYVVPVGCHC